MIEIRNLKFAYIEGENILKGIDLDIGVNEFIGLIGHTGSGKSTLLQQLNGLLLPNEGEVLVEGVSTKKPGKKRIGIRQKVGLVFQYPEYQLFEETIYKDIAFGPKNLKLSEEEIDLRVRKAMEYTGLDFEEYKDRSPFELSGGQQRRVAIAGILAMEPDVLILDEPTAGLDPRGRDEILGQIYEMYESRDMTVILVSHSMEDIANLVDRLLVIDDGKIVLDDAPRKIFSQRDRLQEMGLEVPAITQFLYEYRKKDPDIPLDLITVEEVLNYFLEKRDEQNGR